MTTPTELYACVYAKEFPTQALLRLRPELLHQPCVVMEGDPPLQSVCSLNVKAKATGATHGMTPVEIETLPSVRVLSRSRNEENAAKAALLELAGSFSPRVEDHSSNNAFVSVIDIAGTERLLGSPHELGKALFARIRTLGITACIAVSTNAHASICLAKGLSLLAPVMVLPLGQESAVLAALPLGILDLSEEQAETFASWGIHTLGMLAELPEKELIARMGQEGKRLRQLSRGVLPHLFQAVKPASLLEEQIELESPVELLDSLLFVIAVMLEQLILRVTARILALASITITLSLEGGGSYARTVRPALPSNDRQLWIKLLHLDLEAHPRTLPSLHSSSTLNLGAPARCNLACSLRNCQSPRVSTSRWRASRRSLVKKTWAKQSCSTPTSKKRFAWHGSPCPRLNRSLLLRDIRLLLCGHSAQQRM
jgi:protein ImuB